MINNELIQPSVELVDVCKHFGGIAALDDVSFTINKGEVVALLGDNGAGKSTVVRCISGIHTPDAGEIKVNGQTVRIRSPEEALRLGIETVFQDLALIPLFDITANLFLNRELTHQNPMLKAIGWLDQKEMEKRSESALSRLNSRIKSYREHVINLSGGQRQAVAIARAISWGADIIIMDEPTAALGVEQSAQVNELIRIIKSQGVAVLLISHNMQHVMETCDRAVILYHGTAASTVKIEDVTSKDLVALITGATVQPKLKEINES